MDRFHVIENFYNCVNKRDIDNLLKLFSKNANVHSPIRANANAFEYFTDLINNSKVIKIKVKSIFICKDNPDLIAVNFNLTWDLPGGVVKDKDVVSLVTFEPKSEKIIDYKVIYNAATCEQIIETAIQS